MVRAGRAVAGRWTGNGMTTKTTSIEEPAAPAEDAADAPLIDSVGAAIKKLIARGKERGYVTYDELNAALPTDQVSSEQIEDTMATLSELGVNVVEAEDSEDNAGGENGAAAEAAPPGAAEEDEDLGRTDDPVRMYLREMGGVELLSREGEIAIAKRIEAGHGRMIGAISESPLTLRAMLRWREDVGEGALLLRDVVDLDATYGAASNGAAPAEPSEDGDIGGDGDYATVSLSAMEEKLRPQLLETFDQIARTHALARRLRAKQAALRKDGGTVSRESGRRLEKHDARLAVLVPVGAVERRPRRGAGRGPLRPQPGAGRARGPDDAPRRAREDRPREFPAALPGPRDRSRAGSAGSRASSRKAGRSSSTGTGRSCAASAATSAASPRRSRCRSPNSGGSSTRCSAASARRAGPRRRWSRPICGW